MSTRDGGTPAVAWGSEGDRWYATEDSVLATMGLIINPIAGMGGSVALHGTDGPALQEALELGATPVAASRARRALQAVRVGSFDLTVVAAPGAMGADVALESGLPTEILRLPQSENTTAADTIAAARVLSERPVDLLMFVGGDGTARDVTSAVGSAIPVLGVPAGVKMHSGVFGRTPEVAGTMAHRYLRDPAATPLREVDVMDVAEEGRGSDRPRVRLFGSARIPFVPGMVQLSKASPMVHDDGAMDAVCVEIAEAMEPGRMYLIGPGSTTARILAALGLPGTTLGVDVVLDGELLAVDASEATLLGLLANGRPVSLVLGVIGGQGFLLGRGNQQLSPAVLSMIDRDDITIVAGSEKILALDPPVLYVDLDGAGTVSSLTGYHRVRTGVRSSTMLRVID